MGRTSKMILKVEFLDNFHVKFSLVNLHPYFSNQMFGSKIHQVPNNDFIIYENSNFMISDGLITLPDKHSRSITPSTIKFISDQRRYVVLNEIKNALLHWSGSKYWEGTNIFEKIPEIEYRKNLWILY